MYSVLRTLLFVQCCELCLSITVPVQWIPVQSDKQFDNNHDDVFSMDSFKPEYVQKRPSSKPKFMPIPDSYFVYPDRKPEFAIEVAAFHGVQSPEKHYTSYPILPYTEVQEPVLGKHYMNDEGNNVYKPFQKFVKSHEGLKSHVSPSSSNYEIFHPYKAEEPALIDIYKDPVLDEIRSDIIKAKDRLQRYENDAGESNISKDEYLENPDETDRKIVPQYNEAAPFELHVPHRQPIYYKQPVRYMNRHQQLNQRFKHPLHQTHVKIKPLHYLPLKNHLENFRHQQAVRYDDKENEYPQLPPPQNFAEPSDGYDIYERGKQRYVTLRNNIDEAINDAVRENRPITHQKLELRNIGTEYSTPSTEDAEEKHEDSVDEFVPVKNFAQVHRTKKTNANNEAVRGNRPTTHQKLESQNSGSDYNAPNNEESEEKHDDSVEEFVPVKNFAQVRRTEITKHLPREVALDEASSFEELRNAPRLREAVKSTKAQTVYSEEGYEDSAYDHAGEHKHASDHEGHGGYLKENEISGGKYKIPTVSAAFNDGSATTFGDEIAHVEKWKNDDTDSLKQKESVDYTDDDHEKALETEIYDDLSDDENINKRKSAESGKDKKENVSGRDSYVSESEKKITLQENNEKARSSESMINDEREHEVEKRETEFKVPELDLNDTYLTEKEILETQTKKVDIIEKDETKEKYPYYFQHVKILPKNSPLRYSENLRLIPKKSGGGTEFYDSRAELICPEVDDDINPIPEHIKNNSTDSSENSFSKENEKPGRNPDIGSNDDSNKQRLRGLGDKIDCFKAKYFGENPLDSPFFKEDLIANPEPITLPSSSIYKIKNKFNSSQIDDVYNISEKIKEESKNNFAQLLSQLKIGQTKLQESLIEPSNIFRSSPSIFQNTSSGTNAQLIQQSNVYTDILDNITKKIQQPFKSLEISRHLLDSKLGVPINKTFNYFANKEDVTKAPLNKRKKRATPFVYEPYKIIRDVQITDSKKTTTTGNISPLIKQLQSSKVIDKVAREKDQPVKRNAGNRYKDIGKLDRQKLNENKADISSQFVDVSVDSRRGEPRYELMPPNHKSEYTPVDAKQAISVEEYEKQAKTKIENTKSEIKPIRQRQIEIVATTERPFFDVSKYLPKPSENQKLAASKTVHRIIKTTTPAGVSRYKKHHDNSEATDDEEYEEYDSEEEESQTTTTTTTAKPIFKRRRVTTSSTTTTSTTTTSTTPASRKKSRKQEEVPIPKLRLTTRFNKPTQSDIAKEEAQKNKSDSQKNLPQYREKSKKSTKSTLVTDTKSYGEDDDDMQKDEVDALIQVKQNMDDYMPLYEKKLENKVSSTPYIDEEKSDDGVEEETEKTYDKSKEYEDDEEDDEDEDDDDEEYDDSEEDENEDDEEEKPEDQEEQQTIITTPEPPRKTLLRTTEAPISTTEARNAKTQIKPVVVKKKVVIHKETPVNKSAPHVTQFKQDIKEEEIIKEIPPKKFNKNVEVLELYKNDQLAKEVNKLGDVEIFKANLDVKQGPRHGGNYRSAKLIELQDDRTTPRSHHGRDLKLAKPDADKSQSTLVKVIQYDTDDIPVRTNAERRGSNSKNNASKPRTNSKNTELVELTESEKIKPKQMHGGNLKARVPSRRRGEEKSAKFIEFNESVEDDDEDQSSLHGGNFKSHDNSRNSGRPLHGGNYRSERLVQAEISAENPEQIKPKPRSEKIRNSRNNAVNILNSFAQAVPILTTTPAYILDPSKRMYFYVDA